MSQAVDTPDNTDHPTNQPRTKRRPRRLRNLGISALMATGLVGAAVAVAAPAPPAQAGQLCNATNIWCGELHNRGSIGIGIIHNWPTPWYRLYDRVLYPGQDSDTYWVDTDGYYVGHCYGVWYSQAGGPRQFFGEGQHKITDNIDATLVAVRIPNCR